VILSRHPDTDGPSLFKCGYCVGATLSWGRYMTGPSRLYNP